MLIIIFTTLFLILIIIGVLFYKDLILVTTPRKPIIRPQLVNSASIENLIKEQTIGDSTKTISELFENTNITIPNKKLLELYNKVLALAPEVLFKKIDCNSAILQMDHMYNVCECLISKLRVYHSSSDNTQISQDQFHQLTALLTWIRFMIQNNLSNVGEIFKYNIEDETSQDKSITIIHPSFKDFLNINLIKLKDPKISVTSYDQGGKELIERLEKGISNNIISIKDYISILLQYSDSISVPELYNKNCDCNYKEQRPVTSFSNNF